MSRSLYEQRFTLRAGITGCESAQCIGVAVSEPAYHQGQKRYVVEIRREPLLVRAASTASITLADACNGEARSLTAQALRQTIEEVDATIAELQTHLVWMHRALRDFRTELVGDAFERQLQASTFSLAVQKSRRDHVTALHATGAKQAKAAR